MQYVVLIPSYEPSELLINLLKEIPEEYNIVIVDDGSGDEYKNIFKEAKKYAHVITYKENMGKGYALKTGLRYIKDRFIKYVVVTMDSDGQHRIEDAKTIASFAAHHPSILVLGRRSWNKMTPLRSRIGNTITRFIYKTKTGLSIYDTQTGLRAFSYELIDYMLEMEGNRFEYEMNVLLNLGKNNILFKEIPIETIYLNKNKSSHFKTIKDAIRIYKEIFKWHKNKKH